MNLTKGGSVLSQKLKKLIETHDNLAIAVAWASAGTEVYKVLIKNQKKIKRAVIGTHFYQTHPVVLENFIGNNNVRFILQPQGVFHPKVYLFWSKNSWDMLIGSANLTAAALDKNSELMLHLTTADTHEDIHSQIQIQIEEYWKQAEIITSESVSTYRALWNAQQPALKRVSGAYSGITTSKPPVHTKIMSMSWRSFYNAVQQDPYHGFNERCELLDLVREAFKKASSFAKMNIGIRKTIAGLPNDFNEHWGWFGSMKGAGYFHKAVNENNLHLSAALDFIPLDGAVGHEHYDSYIKEYKKAFPKIGYGIGTSSRLLALKRPDYFVCLDSKNMDLLCRDLGIKQTGMNYERYWDDVVLRILDSVWWNEPKPSDEKAMRVWLGRAAMLDAIFYRP